MMFLMFTYSKYLVIMNSLELHYSKTKGNKFAQCSQTLEESARKLCGIEWASVKKWFGQNVAVMNSVSRKSDVNVNKRVF